MNNWTVLIYMAGDNNLSEDMITAIKGIERATQTAHDNGTYKSSVTFIIEYDGQHPLAKTRRYIISKDKIPAGTFNTYGSTNEPTGNEVIITFQRESPSTKQALSNLIEFGHKHYEAENYALILSGHSDAFRGRTLMLDENQNEAMSLKELRKTLETAVKSLPKGEFDVLAFDSCVMNTLEVMYEFRNVADVWIGSQGSIPNFTWDYEGIATDLIKTDHNVNQFAKTLVDKVQEFNLRYAFGGRSIDISYCRLDDQKLNNVLKKTSEMAEILLDRMFKDYIEIDSAGAGFYGFVQRLLLKAHNMSQTYMYEQSVDITDFSGCLRIECAKVIAETLALCGIDFPSAKPDEISPSDKIFIETELAGNRLSEAAKIKIESCLSIYKVCSNLITAVGHLEKYGAYSGSDYQYSHGVSLFLPWTHISFAMLGSKYIDLEFSRDSDFVWCVFLVLYVNLTARNLDLIEFSKTFGLNLQEAKILGNNGGVDVEANVEALAKFLGGGGGFKDNPKHTRGLEDFMYYFARTRNIYTKFDAKGNF